MKTFHQLFLAILTVAFSFGLSSCEPEEVHPKATTPASQSHNADLAGNLSIKKYYLTAHNTSPIVYDENHRLEKVELDPNFNKQYNWQQKNGQSYLMVSVFYNGYLIRKEQYLLNDRSRCTKLISKQYNPSGEVEFTRILLYNYYANGKLKEFYNQTTLERTAFTYDAAGDLIKITNYAPNGSEIGTREYEYTNQETSVKKLDLYHFNVELANIDFFPKVFGTFTKHLPMSIKIDNHHPNTPIKNFYYRYEFNAEGYPVKRQTLEMADGSVKATQTFHYQVTGIGAP